MSMLLLMTDTDPQKTIEVPDQDLLCDGHISAFPMSWAAVPHPLKILSFGAGEMVWSIPYLRAESGLYVETGILSTALLGQVLVTRVFNLTSKPIKIKPGTVVARLLCTKMVW